jgi:hypothetical protein
MSYRPDFDRNSEWPDDIDKLFDIMGQQDPEPGRAFDSTMESLRRWHSSGLAPAKTPALVKFWSSFTLAKITLAAGLCLALITVSWVTWINAGPGSGQDAKQGAVLVMPTQEAEKPSAYPFNATMEISESDVPTVPKYPRQSISTAAQISSSTVISKYSNLEKLAKLDLSISGSSVVSTRDSRNEDSSQLRRPNNLH